VRESRRVGREIGIGGSREDKWRGVKR